MTAADHENTIREQIAHLGPWRGAVADEALADLLSEHAAELAEAQSFAASCQGTMEEAIDRCLTAERERDEARAENDRLRQAIELPRGPGSGADHAAS